MGTGTLVFGVSGELAEANLLMFDRQTLSTWQQLTGVAISGALRGAHLQLMAVQMTSFGALRATHPDG